MHYISHQNDSFRSEFFPILRDVPEGGGEIGELGLKVEDGRKKNLLTHY